MVLGVSSPRGSTKYKSIDVRDRFRKRNLGTGPVAPGSRRVVLRSYRLCIAMEDSATERFGASCRTCGLNESGFD